jgi:hypothetical protein
MTHGSENRQRTARLDVRLTPEERAIIQAHSERAGLTAGSYARRVLLGAETPRQVRRPPVEREQLARLLGHLGKIGSLLNQIARALNSDQDADLAALRDGLTALGIVRVAVLKALGRAP